MLKGQTFWHCEKCGRMVQKKRIGNRMPRQRMRCGCKEINVTHKELEETNGKVTNERCLEAGWFKAKVILSSECNDDKNV